MNRAAWKPALLILVVLVIVTASGFLIRSNTGTAKTPDISKADEQAIQAAQPREGSEPPKTAAAPRMGDNPKNSEGSHQLLETVGVLMAAHYYQTYFNIGLLADGKAKGTYTDKDAQKVLDSVLSLLHSVDQQLAGLGKIDLDKADRASLEQMRVLSALLRQQGKQLETFWDSGQDEDAAKYENVRKDTWAAISKLTGIGR